MGIYEPMWIAHVDLDAFFASVEQRDDPKLRGRPVVVGGKPQSRGVVCAASYEARQYGVRSAMSCAEAYRRCPEAIFVPPDFARYSAASRAVMACCRTLSDAIEPLSLDEAFLDLTHCHDDATEMAAKVQGLRDAIREATGLTASAGVAPNKFLAKMASDACKPNGLRVIAHDDAARVAATLPIQALPGVGRVTAERLRSRGIRLVQDLLTIEAEDPGRLRSLLGQQTEHFLCFARGEDPRQVSVDHTRLSIGIEDTFAADCDDPRELIVRLDRLANGLAERMARQHQRARTLTLKVKWSDFRQTTRSQSVSDPFTGAAAVTAHAARLLDEVLPGRGGIRLLGLAASHLEALDGIEQTAISFAG
jgi:DNA polymerase IV